MSENAVYKESHLPIGLPKGSILSENVVKKEYRQNQMALKARIKHRTQSLQSYKQHLKNGTFPKRMKSIKPYPKMDTPQTQAKVIEACQLVDKVILGQMIQEQTLKLKEDQDSLQTIKKTRLQQRQASRKEPTVIQLQRELKDLQAKYRDLSQKLMKQESPES